MRLLVAVSALMTCLVVAASAGAYRDATAEESAAIMAKPPPTGLPYPIEWEYIHVSEAGPWAEAKVVQEIPGQGPNPGFALYRGSGSAWDFISVGTDRCSDRLGMPAAVQEDLGYQSCKLQRRRVVVCLTELGNKPTGKYQYRPRHCDFHKRGDFPAAHVNTQVTQRLHWRHWGRLTAVAVGQIGISTVGWEKVRVKLNRPKEVCDRVVFTNAVFNVRVRFEGESHRYRYRLPLDTCLI